MTTTELKGPEFCAECGSQFTREIILAGGSRPAAVTIRKHRVAIPGLFTCTGCDTAIEMGVRESRITVEAALSFLENMHGPVLTAAVEAGNETAIPYLVDCIEVSNLLEMLIQLKGEPGGLDFIPECTGDCGSTPRQMAHLN